jgi:hypothetical protein
VNKAEAAHLLLLASAFDRWITVDDDRATVWAYALENLPFELARVAVVEHYKGPNAHKAIMPADIIAAVESAARLTRPQVEADVRSAKARGLVDQSWPDAQVLPDLVRERLAAAREGDRVAVLELGSPDRIGAHEFKDMDERL